MLIECELDHLDVWAARTARWCEMGMSFKEFKDICSIWRIKSTLKKGLRVKLQFRQSWNSVLDTVGIPTGLRVRMRNRERCVNCWHRMWAGSPKCLSCEDGRWWGKGMTFKRFKDICTDSAAFEESESKSIKDIDQRYLQFRRMQFRRIRNNFADDKFMLVFEL